MPFFLHLQSTDINQGCATMSGTDTVVFYGLLTIAFQMYSSKVINTMISFLVLLFFIIFCLVLFPQNYLDYFFKKIIDVLIGIAMNTKI